ncbi:hypothetical protein LUZ60_009226 [Juncus effusus]|nr:hypothetical protein LUZ60_009226 [Juncus effusus]
MVSGIGEMFASPIVKELSKKLGSAVWQEISQQWNFQEDLKKMKEMLVTVEAVLREAERQSLKQEPVRLWLKKLKSIAYDIDDLLCDYEFEVTDRPKKARRRDKVKIFFSSSNHVISQISMAKSLKSLRERLDEIVKGRIAFDLKLNARSFNSLDDRVIKKRETFSEIDLDHQTTVVGRNNEKEKIINLLLQVEGEEDIAIIPIYGLGGIGKTTLAQLVFNDERVQENFSLRAWVYVSMEFDLLTIGKAVISQTNSRHGAIDNLESVRISLKCALDDNKYLVILDDMWEEAGQQLEKLKQMLCGGRRGSKIVVTTRSHNVAIRIASRNVIPHNLTGLSDEDCWSVFSQRAFRSGHGGTSSLVEIGREIVKKCKGVPLAAKALGYILCSKEDSIDVWLAIRDSEFWELEEDDVIPSLKLSYSHMPSPLKLCFAYCAIVPKGHHIDRDKLIQQWVALGLIKQDQKLTAEKIGEEYVNILLGMSFLQYMTRNDETRRLCTMHDLVHDLTMSIVGDEALIADGRKETNYNPTYNDDSHYVLLINYKNKEPPMESKPLPRKVRALHFLDCKWKLLPTKVFSEMKCLRVLNLSGCSLQELPNSIGQLKHLRYLDISDQSLLETLPAYIGKLRKLNNLKLHGCTRLLHLPESLYNLENLLDLDLSDCSSLKMLPEYFGNLKGLNFLRLSGCSQLKELPESTTNLVNLVHLDLSGCSDLWRLPSSFGNLSKLRILYLSGCVNLRKLPESITNLKTLLNVRLSDCRCLNMLPEDFGSIYGIQFLDLSSCNLQKLPESFGDLMNLEHLNLATCYTLNQLPENFGNLKKLQDLNLSSCYALTSLPDSFLNLVNLKDLNLSNCINLERLPEHFGEENNVQIDLSGCGLTRSEFTTDILGNSQIVPDLQVYQELIVCEEIEQHGDMCSSIVKLEHLNQTSSKLRIVNLENVYNPKDAERAKLYNKSKLYSLTLEWTPHRSIEYTELDQGVLEKLLPHPNLGKFELDGYSSCKLPNWVLETSFFLPNLVHIRLFNLVRCEQFPSFGILSNLEVLEIKNAPGIQKVEKEHCTASVAYRKLRELYLSEMPNLEEWVTLSGNGEELTFPSLSIVIIVRCPSLIFNPYIPRGETMHLIESNNVVLSGSSCTVPSKSQTIRLYVDGCNVSSVNWRVLHSLTRLEHLEINSCQELIDLPYGISGLAFLKFLRVSRCEDLITLGQQLGKLKSLQSVWIEKCFNLVALPNCIRNLSFSRKFYVLDCSPALMEYCRHIPCVVVSELVNEDSTELQSVDEEDSAKLQQADTDEELEFSYNFEISSNKDGGEIKSQS